MVFALEFFDAKFKSTKFKNIEKLQFVALNKLVSQRKRPINEINTTRCDFWPKVCYLPSLGLTAGAGDETRIVRDLGR